MSNTSFNCPYCWSDVPVQASICGHCTRDLVMFKPLALRLQTLADEVAQLKVSAQQHAESLTQLQSRDIQAVGLSYAKTQHAGQTSTTSPVIHPPSLLNWLVVVVLTIAIIGLCHWVLLFIYDAAPIFLRLLTIALPTGFGFICARRSGLNWPAQLLAAIMVSACSVGLMLGITSHIDGVPLLPNNTRDWRETIEYTTAIGLGFFTGYLAYRLMTRWEQQQRDRINLRVLLAREEKGQFKITEISNQVQSLITATAPLASAGVALYSGLKAFTGQ
jgi:hypothetical protein